MERKGIDTAVRDLRNCAAEDISVLFARKYRDNVVGVEGLLDGEERLVEIRMKKRWGESRKRLSDLSSNRQTTTPRYNTDTTNEPPVPIVRTAHQNMASTQHSLPSQPTSPQNNTNTNHTGRSAKIQILPIIDSTHHHIHAVPAPVCPIGVLLGRRRQPPLRTRPFRRTR